MVNGYHSDVTRTFAVGKIDNESKEIYEIVKTAQQMALDALINGVSSLRWIKLRGIISRKGYDPQFGHGLGHGFGLEIHEQPRASVGLSTDILTEGMTITVEPGIYVEGKCGVREDCCVLTKTGHHNFVTVTKELLSI